MWTSAVSFFFVIREVFPYLRVRQAQAAVDFYTRVFGASERFRLTEPSGRVGHLEMQLGPATLMLCEEVPEFDIHAPPPEGVQGVSVHLHLDNVDAVVTAAVAAGATLVRPPADQFYGERSATLRDPFGHTWLVGHEIEKVTPEEMQRRYKAMFE